MDVGFIGLGQMGSAIALNLVKAGHRVVVYNRTRAKAEALASQGAEVAESVADACRRPVLITMLADDAAVEAAFFGDGNGLSALGKGAVHISMSTISVALSDRLAEAHRNAGQPYVAAPVFGRPEAAAAAKLFVVAAGPEAQLTRCQPLFDAIGQRTFVVGDKPSSANLVKLSGNFLLAAMIECLGEAFALIRKGGVDPHAYLEILTNTLFSAPAYKTYGTIIANQQYEPAGFKMSLGLKDIRLALAAADALATPMPVASLVHDHFLSGVAQGAGDSDWSALARLAAVERRSLSRPAASLSDLIHCGMSTAPPVVPELDVADLARSVSFYVDVLGFSVRIERPEERFAYLTRGPVHLMLEQADGPGRRFRTAPLEYPFGRGMNLQIEVPDVDHLHAQALRAGAAIYIPLEERWYRRGDEEAGHRQFVVIDPDGYLLRFFTSLGRRQSCTVRAAR